MVEDIKKRSLHRVKILEGQLRGLAKMIDSEEYCMEIITQSLAIQKSLGSLNKLIAENHIKTHVSHSLASGDATKQANALQELMDIFELNNNRGTK
jgi:DNA-binding FrmR family transcriptional regulator